ncbi:hypothetical protein PVMG_05734 [Plasmodium vivax Mauritania I]|uniref:Uncharacterized protein n=1 Tax=Plasmodium vivax Mauritania I TaxID=1035515 RepID=A0A0J9T7E2_PLAVI|nr:hypothetical protein PVMG_05734 [Plasmodium vivax Mauritania I]
MNYLNGNTWKVRNDRLLTNDDPQNEIGQSDTSDNITLPAEQNIIKDITESSEIDEKTKKDISKSMFAYIKKLEHGYSNKKVLKRLDCLYEKKLLKEMYKLDNIAGHMKNKNSYFKNVIWKRYGLRFFIFTLVILFGIAISIFCHVGRKEGDDIKCNGTNPLPGNGPCSNCKHVQKVILGSNGIIYIPLIIAFLSFIIYTTSKVRKYKRLKKKYCK